MVEEEGVEAEEGGEVGEGPSEGGVAEGEEAEVAEAGEGVGGEEAVEREGGGR